MICTKCNESGVLNTILGKDFWYCRNCKDEILLEQKLPTPADFEIPHDVHTYTPIMHVNAPKNGNVAITGAVCSVVASYGNHAYSIIGNCIVCGARLPDDGSGMSPPPLSSCLMYSK